MKLTIVLSTTHTETNWNALRLANLALKKGDEVSLFLLGEAVEYENASSDRFNIKQQIDTFLNCRLRNLYEFKKPGKHANLS